MKQTFKERQRTSRAAGESDLTAPTASLSDTTDTTDLIAAIEELLEV